MYLFLWLFENDLSNHDLIFFCKTSSSPVLHSVKEKKATDVFSEIRIFMPVSKERNVFEPFSVTYLLSSSTPQTASLKPYLQYHSNGSEALPTLKMAETVSVPPISETHKYSRSDTILCLQRCLLSFLSPFIANRHMFVYFTHVKFKKIYYYYTFGHNSSILF
jgi:hypothetical protein